MTFVALCKKHIPKCSVATQHRSVRCEVPTRYIGLLPTAALSHESIWRSVSELGAAHVGDADSFIDNRKCGNIVSTAEQKQAWQYAGVHW